MNQDQTRIMVVDDEADLRTILRECLQLAGFQVVEAEDGKQAWRQLESAPEDFHAIVLDRKIPGLDGMELLRRIKRNDRMQSIPVILQTGLGDEQQIVEGLEAGAYYYLIKPYEQRVLVSVVGAAIADHRRHRAVLDKIHLGVSTLGLLRQAEYCFQTPEEARSLAASLSNAFPQPMKAAMGLLELFFNAIEHGNLELGYDLKGQLQAENRWLEEISRRLKSLRFSARCVHVRVTRLPEVLEVEIEDEGNGFNWKDFLEMSAERATHTNGRGIALARAISFDSLEYLGRGNLVRVSAAIALQ